MFAMSASASYAATTKAIATPRRASRASRATSVIRAADAAKDAAPAAPAVWTAPKLNPNTPSPIFGGSTGGLLRKAQVRASDSGSRYARLGPRRMARVRAALCIARAAMPCARARGRRIFMCSIADARDRGRARVAWVRSRADPRTRIGAYQRESISQRGLSRARVLTVLCAWFSVMYRWRSSTCSRGKRRRKPSLKCRCVRDARERDDERYARRFDSMDAREREKMREAYVCVNHTRLTN